jgi:hypothetical protein
LAPPTFRTDLKVSVTLMPRPEPLSPEETLLRYNPAIGRYPLTSPREWAAKGLLVREAAYPFIYLAGEQVRPYLRAMTKLAAFAYRLDGEMTLEAVLDPWVIRSFLAGLPTGTVDEEPILWRLASERGTITPQEPVRRSVSPRPYKNPYLDAEVAALLLASDSLSTELLRNNLLSVVVLGAGCGLVRSNSRGVTAGDVHHHDDGLFVRSAQHCAKVRDVFEPRLRELIHARPTGQLLGPSDTSGSTVKLHQMLDHRRRIPHLSVDRLRATYINGLLTGEANLLQIIRWAGLKSLDSLGGCVEQLPPSSSCPTEVDP